jgi:nicotinamidase-related amidase
MDMPIPMVIEREHHLLEKEHCALVVVDLQEKLLPAIFEKERVIKNAKLLIECAKILQLPIILTQQYPRGLGETERGIREALPAGLQPIDKLEFGCFGNPGFREAVQQLKPRRNTLLLAGIESHVCVTQTALGAVQDGFRVHVAADATSSRSEFNWKIGLDRMKDAGAQLSSTEMMIYELLARSGTPEFKAMLSFLK